MAGSHPSLVIGQDTTVVGAKQLADTFYDVQIPRAGKYVLELKGPSEALGGVYEGGSPDGSKGKLRVCGANVRGVRMLNAGQHLLLIRQLGDGGITFKLRPWSFGDYFTINFYKSTC